MIGKIIAGSGLVLVVAVASYAAISFNRGNDSIKMWFDENGTCHYKARYFVTSKDQKTDPNNYCLKFINGELDDATLKRIVWETGKGIDSENAKKNSEYEKWSQRIENKTNI